MWIDVSLRDFAAAAAAREPTPGGGSVAAYLAAVGAALGAMAARFTEGKQAAAGHEDALAEEIARLDGLRGRFEALVDGDCEAFATVDRAMKLPKGTEAEKAARREAMQAALKTAMETPLQTCRLAAEGLAVLDELKDHVTPHLVSDVAVAAYALGAAYRAAWVNVLINVGGIRDGALVAKVKAEGEALAGHVERAHASVTETILAEL